MLAAQTHVGTSLPLDAKNDAAHCIHYVAHPRTFLGNLYFHATQQCLLYAERN